MTRFNSRQKFAVRDLFRDVVTFNTARRRWVEAVARANRVQITARMWANIDGLVTAVVGENEDG